MKNKTMWFIFGGIIIIVIIIAVLLLSKNNNKLNVELEKIWNLSRGSEITSDMYENQDYDFMDDDGNNGFVSIDKGVDGYVLVGTNNATENTTQGQGIIEYYDLNGKILWTKNYPSTNSDNCKLDSNFNNVLAVSDGYIVFGEEETYFTCENGYSNNMILKYDLNGNLLWKKEYNNTVSMGDKEDIGNTTTYDFVDVISLNERYYIIGNYGEYQTAETNISSSNKMGFVMELDVKGNEISFNKYEDNSEFYSAKVIDNTITINSFLGYDNSADESSNKMSENGSGIITFKDSNFNLSLKYSNTKDNYREFEYLDGIYYLVDPTTDVNISAIDKDGNVKFNTYYEDPEKNPLRYYVIEDIATDGTNIYTYAYYDDYSTGKKISSAIIVFDKEGNYDVIDINKQYYYQLVIKDNYLLLPGNENGFTKYKINK